MEKFEKPFDTKHLPKKMETLSPLKEDEKLMFFDLIKHRIAFDYLLALLKVQLLKMQGFCSSGRYVCL